MTDLIDFYKAKSKLKSHSKKIKNEIEILLDRSTFLSERVIEIVQTMEVELQGSITIIQNRVFLDIGDKRFLIFPDLDTR